MSPDAICEKCGWKQRWHNYRGAKLSDIPCDSCGGRLRPIGYKEGIEFKKIKKTCPDVIRIENRWDTCKLRPLNDPTLFAYCQLRGCPKMEKGAR